MRLFTGKTYTLFIIREYLRVFFICIIFIMGISYIVRALQQSEAWKAFGIGQILVIYALEAPEIVLREALLPSCMFASVFSVGILSRNREILALRSCGISTYRIILPLMVVGFVVSLLSLLAEDYLLIKSMQTRDIYLSKLSGAEQKVYLQDRENVIVFGEKGTIYRIDRYSAQSSEMSGLMVIQKDERGDVSLRIDAEKALWDGHNWVLYSGIVYNFGPGGSIEGQKMFSKLGTSLHDDPRYFSRDIRKIENMKLREGYEYIRMTRKMGLNYRSMLTKYHGRIARSVTLFLVTVIGLALGSMPVRNALVISFSMTLGFVLVFFFIIELGNTFGGSGAVPPAVGGWLGNIIFSFVSLYLLKRIRV